MLLGAIKHRSPYAIWVPIAAVLIFVFIAASHYLCDVSTVR
jgi:hypothetical protein